MRDMPYRANALSDHARHDQLLVAQLAAGDDLDPDARAMARALIDGCAECRLLADDLGLLARAIAAEPAPTRPRDFRLTPAQAERARGSWLERLATRLRLPDGALLRPLAGATLALGMLLIAVGTVVPPATVPASDAVTPTLATSASEPPAGTEMMMTMATPAVGEQGVQKAPAAGDIDMMARSSPEPAMDTMAGETTEAEAALTAPELAIPAGAGTDTGPSAGASPATTEAAMAATIDDGDEGPLAGVPGQASGVAAAPADAGGGRNAALLMGLLFALAGVVIAWLAWLAKRTEDPLVR